MKRLVLFFIILLTIIDGYSQENNALMKADSLNTLSVEYYNLGNYQEAIRFVTEALSIKEQLSEKDDVDYAIYLDNLAIYHSSINKYEAAIQIGNKAIEIFEKTIGKEAIIYVESLNRLANNYAALGKYNDAIIINKNASDILKKQSGKNNIELAILLSNMADYHAALSMYNEAVKLENEAITIIENQCGKDNLDYAISLGKIADYNAFLGKYEVAINKGTETLAIKEKIRGKEDIDYSVTLHKLAEYYAALENFAKAIDLENEVLSIIEKIYGKEHSDYVVILGNIAEYNAILGNYQIAIEKGNELLSIKERTIGKEHLDYAMSLNLLANYYAASKNFAKAIDIEDEVLSIIEKIYGKEHSDYVLTLSNLAEYNLMLGKWQIAIEQMEKALVIMKQILGEEHHDYLTAFDRLADYYSAFGKYSEAQESINKILNLRIKINGKNSIEYVKTLRKLVSCKIYQGNYMDAINLAKEVRTVTNNLLGSNHLDYALATCDLAVCEARMGNFSKAIELEYEAIKIKESKLGTNSYEYIESLISLASCYAKLGHYDEAIKKAEEALERRKQIATTIIDSHDELSILASVNYTLGNDYKALSYNTERLNILREKLPPSHPEFIYCLLNAADSYETVGNTMKSIQLYNEALNIISNLMKSDNKKSDNITFYVSCLIRIKPLFLLGRQCIHDEFVDFDTTLNELLNIFDEKTSKRSGIYKDLLSFLADEYYFRNDYEKAIEFENKALEMKNEIYGKQVEYAYSLIRLAEYYFKIEDYAAAIKHSLEAIQICEVFLGKNHPEYINSIQQLALYYYRQGDIEKSIDYFCNASNLYKKYICSIFVNITSKEREDFWEWNSNFFNITLPLYSHYIKNSRLNESLYDMTLLSKGLLLNADMEMRKLLLKNGETEVLELFNELVNTRNILNKTLEKPLDKRYLNTDSLQYIINQKEIELIQKSKVYGDYTKNLDINWKDIQKVLRSNEAAIEFIVFPTENNTIKYIALVIKPGMQSPQMVSLFEERQLKNIETWNYYSTDKIYNLVWKPLENELNNIQNIYFSPSGALHNIAIETIPMDDKHLISDKYNVFRLSSTRQLAKIEDKYEGKGCNIYGGLDYSNGSVEQSHVSKNRALSYVDFLIADSLNLRSGVASLPATKIEAVNINKQLQKNHIESYLYTDSIGTETSIKDLSGKRSKLLHVATHGFYWTEKEVDSYYINEQVAFRNQNISKEDKALTRSGLIMAGANKALMGEVIPEGMDNGILTAKEIAYLDLRGMDLAVLSACQTGLGEITGEGVFGLQRGFKKAGVKTLLMSLWKVDDNATQLLMSKFYEYLFSGDNNVNNADRINGALKNAQKYVREYVREKKVKVNSNLTPEQERRMKRSGKKIEERFKIIKGLILQMR